MNRLKWGAATAAMVVFGLAGAVVAGPLEDGQKAFANGDYETALKLLAPLADQGNADAQFRLGVMYFSGAGVKEDDVQGAAWTWKAADQGSAAAKAWLLLACMGPTAGPEDKCEQVFAGVRTAAEHGDAKAQAQLGSLYLVGKGVAKDAAQGVVWIRKAADQGDTDAQVQLGLLYSSSFMGVPEDHAQSLAWYRKAADQGNMGAMAALAMNYEHGFDGAPKDDAQAAAWYLKAAEKGELLSQSALAKMYDEGRGVPKDPAQALYWYRKLAERGDTDAQAKIGSAYALGKGVPQDYVQAYVWLDVAVVEAAGGKPAGPDDTALARDSVASHLTPAQLADAKQQSAALRAKLDAQ
jgi:TPR repeat protein